MTATIQSPVCEVTGLPLPILPTEPHPGARFLYQDFHHHFHPRTSPELEGLAGQALRFSRGQDIPRFLHNRYHELFAGPVLPVTEEEKFRLTVLACAGVVPRHAINLDTGGGYSLVELDYDEYELLAAPRSIHIEKAYKFNRGSFHRRQTIGMFFAAYAMQQNVREVVSNHVIEQFVDDTTKPERKKELGNFILKEALDLSLDALIPFHRELKQEGYVRKEHATGLNEVVRKFFNKKYYSAYHGIMAVRLAGERSLQTEVNELELAS